MAFRSLFVLTTAFVHPWEPFVSSSPHVGSHLLEASLRRGSGTGVTGREVDVSSFNAISGAFYNSLEYLSIAQTISPSTRLHALAGSAVTFRRWRVGLCLRRLLNGAWEK